MSNNTDLRPVNDKSWPAGLRNMLRKENARWWNFKSILVQALVWLIIVNGMVGFVMFVLADIDTPPEGSPAGLNNSTGAGDSFSFTTATPNKLVEFGISIFFSIAALAIPVGAAILCHDSVLKERETGTVAWVLSKPLSRKAFLVSKFLANGIGMLAFIVLVQGIVAYALCSFRLGGPVDTLPFFGGLALIGLNCLFYAFLAMAAGTLSTSRATALGIPLVVLFSGLLLKDIPSVSLLSMVMPWGVGQAAENLAITGFLSFPDLLPIGATILWIAIFVTATLWKFERAEL